MNEDLRLSCGRLLRDARTAKRIAVEVPVAHGVETWAKIRRPDAVEMAELLADSVDEIRSVLRDLEAYGHR